MQDYQNTNWWKYMDDTMKDLAQQSYELLNNYQASDSKSQHKDFSFVVFPMAKAYEGFLKKIFLDMGLIGMMQYKGEHFRIGKVLNPNLPRRYRSGWVFEKLAMACGGEDLPLNLWETWKRARNRVFHFFPDHAEFLTLEDARDLLTRIGDSMDRALLGCDLSH